VEANTLWAARMSLIVGFAVVADGWKGLTVREYLGHD